MGSGLCQNLHELVSAALLRPLLLSGKAFGHFVLHDLRKKESEKVSQQKSSLPELLSLPSNKTKKMVPMEK